MSNTFLDQAKALETRLMDGFQVAWVHDVEQLAKRADLLIAGLNAIAEQLADRLVLAGTENAGLRKDAERYRWLRESDCIYLPQVFTVHHGNDGAIQMLSGQWMDARIDQVMAEEKL